MTIVGAADGTVDDLTRDALADLEAFWAARFPEVLRAGLEPLQGGYFSVDPDAVRPGDFPDGVGAASGRSPWEQRFHCRAPDAPHSDSISYDSHLAELAEEYGRFIPALVMAHEFGHAIQTRVGAPRPRSPWRPRSPPGRRLDPVGCRR